MEHVGGLFRAVRGKKRVCQEGKNGFKILELSLNADSDSEDNIKLFTLKLEFKI